MKTRLKNLVSHSLIDWRLDAIRYCTYQDVAADSQEQGRLMRNQELRKAAVWPFRCVMELGATSYLSTKGPRQFKKRFHSATRPKNLQGRSARIRSVVTKPKSNVTLRRRKNTTWAKFTKKLCSWRNKLTITITVILRRISWWCRARSSLEKKTRSQRRKSASDLEAKATTSLRLKAWTRCWTTKKCCDKLILTAPLNASGRRENSKALTTSWTSI